ncbi:glycyl-radical enzyme activating protein [Desulforamulus ruminis]|uniref:Glycyl-radical enzyme activating protein family n=1 Tax=Desulforamulus ruminis (strain ATCC 23193 / DSM 2154 / NCIMB 8452 / DL) TaxID=696281 RepID=F6DKL8_DESRL|nr:glycyl-radical enzyme activating protein [Desulforamulus ruminis]AEG60393.1 glycyl-radical enzyme activating protein family [Desulforamulus ruminis DSM 2154]
MEATGQIFQIQRWSVHDGPGLRTTIFFKGCPLRCRWCANPESWNSNPEILFFRDRCTGCGQCTSTCAAKALVMENGHPLLDKEKCRVCNQCCEICPTGARKKMGFRIPVGEVVKAVQRDAVFYRESGGGVTFSGGEPFAQGVFLRSLAAACKKLNIDTAVETSGYFSWESSRDILELLDHVLVDIKHMDPQTHRQLTGVSNRQILDNIIAMSRIHPHVLVRVPLISGINDQEENLREMCRFLVENTSITGVELLPYHHLGVAKFRALGFTGAPVYKTPGEEKQVALKGLIASYGLENIDFKA